MSRELQKITYVTIFLLAALIVGEIALAINMATRSKPYWLGDSLYLSLWWTGPITIVTLSILNGKGLIFPLSLGWACLITGIFVQYTLYAHSDPSEAFLTLISLVSYWACGVLATISIFVQRP
jgi:hypothetical protein